jgi:hypothetical protein
MADRNHQWWCYRARNGEWLTWTISLTEGAAWGKLVQLDLAIGIGVNESHAKWEKLGRVVEVRLEEVK